MKAAGLENLLKQEGSYTVFAPTDESFESLSEDDLTMLKSQCSIDIQPCTFEDCLVCLSIFLCDLKNTILNLNRFVAIDR